MKTYILIKVRCAMRYISFSEEEQNAKDFEETFVDNLILKSE